MIWRPTEYQTLAAEQAFFRFGEDFAIQVEKSILEMIENGEISPLADKLTLDTVIAGKNER